MALRRLMACTSLPGCVTVGFRGLPTGWRGRHRLMCGGRVLLPAVHPGRHTLAELARWTPATLTAWRLGRLLTAASGHGPRLVSWWAQELWLPLPPPPHGVRSLWGDGSPADKRGTRHPVGQPGRLRPPPPWFWGVRFVVVLAAWAGSRVPVGWRLLLPTGHAHERSAQGVVRAMVDACVPPTWAQLRSVGGDAAAGSQAPSDLGTARAQTAPARRWGLVVALARTWKTVEEQAMKQLVTPGPPTDSPGTRVPRAPGRKGRHTFGTSRPRVWRRPGGAGTGVGSQKGRNVRPPPPPSLGTTLTALTPRHGGGLSHTRWALARLHWERKAGWGLGEPHVSGETNRRETSVGMAVLASVLVRRGGHHEMVPGNPWRLFPLQHTCR
jgi:hypothetical protein